MDTDSDAKPEEVKAKRISPAQIRAQRDIADFDDIPGVKLEWPDKDNFMRFFCSITPTEGLYKGAKFDWEIVIPSSYPHSAPKCLLKTLPIYHPNIDWDGKPCLNILREDWRPVLSLGSVLQGLLFLYLQPNPYDPLNHVNRTEVADKMIADEKAFERNTKLSLRGGFVEGRQYQKLV